MPDFSVLVVCTANLCRSPAAAALLSVGLPPGSPVSIGSAGTSAAAGREVPQPLARALAKRGVDITGHRPRQLTAELVGEADLVLVATRSHRSTVVGAVPGALRRTFTLLEMARLLAAPQSPRWVAADTAGAAPGAGAVAPVGDGGLTGWASLAESAAQRRGAAAGAQDDLTDPYGRSARAYRSCVRDVARAAATILDAAGASSLTLPGR